MGRLGFLFIVLLAACGAERALEIAAPGPQTPDLGRRDLAPACTGPWAPSTVVCTGAGSCDDGNNCTYDDACQSGVCKGQLREDCRPCRTDADCCGAGLKPAECSIKHNTVVEFWPECGLLGCKSRSTDRPCQ